MSVNVGLSYQYVGHRRVAVSVSVTDANYPHPPVSGASVAVGGCASGPGLTTDGAGEAADEFDIVGDADGSGVVGDITAECTGSSAGTGAADPLQFVSNEPTISGSIDDLGGGTATITGSITCGDGCFPDGYSADYQTDGGVDVGSGSLDIDAQGNVSALVGYAQSGATTVSLGCANAFGRYGPGRLTINNVLTL